MKKILLAIALLMLPLGANAVPGKVGQIKIGMLQQSIDGVCDFGYTDSNKTNAFDTVLTYVDLISPWADCVEEANWLKDPTTNPNANPNIKLFLYISLGDMPGAFTQWWRTRTGEFDKSRKVGWYRNWIDSMITLGTIDTTGWGKTVGDIQERLWLHFYDNTNLILGGVMQTIPGTLKDSSQITAADSISRVPNGYASSAWGGSTWSAVSRLFPNLTTKTSVDAQIAYLVYLVTNQSDNATWNLLPNSNYYFDGAFFDNSMDFGLADNVVGGVGGHIVESFDVTWGAGDIALAYAANPDTMTRVSSNTGGQWVPDSATVFDNWWWDFEVQPFFAALNSVYDTLATPSGAKAVYSNNAGTYDHRPHQFDSALGTHYAVLEWGGQGSGIENSLWSTPDGRSFSVDSIRFFDSLAIARGSYRSFNLRFYIYDNSAGPTSKPYDTRDGGISGGGTQSWHEAQIYTYIFYLLLNSANTYYSLFDLHNGYYGAANATAAGSQTDSLCFGSQGLFNLRATLNRDFGAPLQAHPYKYQTITADAQVANIWARDYAGSVDLPNNFKVLYRERVAKAGPWMSNSTPVAITLDTTYALYGNDYAKGATIADTMDSWRDTVSVAAYSTIYLRAGEGAILYASNATDNPPTVLTFEMGAAGATDNDTICTGAVKNLQYNVTDGEGLDSVYIIYASDNQGGAPDTLYRRGWLGGRQGLDATGYWFSSTHAADSIFIVVVDTAGNRTIQRLVSPASANDLIPVTLLGRCAANQPPTGSVIGPVAADGDSVCTSDTVIISMTLHDDTDIDGVFLFYFNDTIFRDTIATVVTDTVINFNWAAPDTAISTLNAIFLKAFDNVGDSVYTATIRSFNVKTCVPPGPRIYRVGPPK